MRPASDMKFQLVLPLAPCTEASLANCFICLYIFYASLCIIPSVQVKGKVKCKTSCAQSEVQKALSWQIFLLSICSLTVKQTHFFLLNVGILSLLHQNELFFMNIIFMNYIMFIKKDVLCLL